MVIDIFITLSVTSVWRFCISVPFRHPVKIGWQEHRTGGWQNFGWQLFCFFGEFVNILMWCYLNQKAKIDNDIDIFNILDIFNIFDNFNITLPSFYSGGWSGKTEDNASRTGLSSFYEKSWGSFSLVIMMLIIIITENDVFNFKTQVWLFKTQKHMDATLYSQEICGVMKNLIDVSAKSQCRSSPLHK